MTHSHRISAAMLACALGASQLPAQAAELALAQVFSDHAVLQREQALNIWGQAVPGHSVHVTLGASTVSANADAQGKWRATLPAQPAGGPYQLLVSSDGASIARHDILIGDVYLCSGQSNMEFAQRNATNAAAASYAGTLPQLRYLNVPKHSAMTPQDDFGAATAWQTVSPNTVGEASAVCFYMARQLQARYQVPVGFINASWGGTTIQSWISAQSLAGFGDYRTGVAAISLYGKDPVAAMAAEGQRSERWWQAHDGAAADQLAWASAEFDDSSWHSVTPGGSWRDSGVADFAQFAGVAWYRTSVTLSPQQAQAANQLHLGTIDSHDTTWVNGVRIGATSIPWIWRDYAVPAGVWRAGRNVIAIRVLSGAHSGGLTAEQGQRYIRLNHGQQLALPASWKLQRGSALTGLTPPSAPWDWPNSLTTLYNGMIAPLMGYHFKLVAWYQGEANAGAADEYRSLLPLLMRDWRQRLDQPALPFMVAQLTSFGDTASQPGNSSWAELRHAQAQAVYADAHAGLAVTLDVGDRYDIHPTQKSVVGDRLARAAQVVAYGEAGAPAGPAATAAQRRGEDIVISFRDAGKGLTSYSSDRVIGFEVCSAQACHYADAHVAGHTVVLPGAARSGITKVRYGWADAPFVNLFSRDDLPVGSFQLALP